jgi:hypothetical protein
MLLTKKKIKTFTLVIIHDESVLSRVSDIASVTSKEHLLVELGADGAFVQASSTAYTSYHASHSYYILPLVHAICC